MGTITFDHIRVEITPDDSPENPRDWDNLGTMACWHRRYTLGDAHPFHDPREFTKAVNERTAIILPLYVFDHSGLSISTSSAQFHACDPAGWDWGQVGYMYVMKEDVRREFGRKLLSYRTRAQVEECLRGEVAVYDQYLRGEVYGYTVTDRHTGEVIDSCWGFYGENPHANGMADSFSVEYRDAILAYFYRGAA